MTGELTRRVKVLIVSLPGVMQNVLRETFTCRADVEKVGVASGCLSALGMIPEFMPDLVVIDSSLPEAESSQLILRLKQNHQRTHSLVLVETTQQYNKAVRIGADSTVRSYILAENLDTLLDNLFKNS